MKAACFLKTQGYQILERRSTNESCLPEEAVDLRKQRQISRVAAWYLTEKGLDIYTPCRFDVVAIEGEEIRLYRDAFFYQG